MKRAMLQPTAQQAVNIGLNYWAAQLLGESYDRIADTAIIANSLIVVEIPRKGGKGTMFVTLSLAPFEAHTLEESAE